MPPGTVPRTAPMANDSYSGVAVGAIGKPLQQATRR
jgi:hypothetical protein